MTEVKQLLTDGVLGLGIGTKDGNPTIIENLRKQGTIKRGVFALYLNGEELVPDQDDIDEYNFWADEASPLDECSLTIGGFDLATYSSAKDFTYFQVVQDSEQWALTLLDVKVNQHSMSTKSTLAVIDSSYGVTKGPSDEVHTIYDQYFTDRIDCVVDPNAKLLVCYCDESNMAQFPTVHFAVAGQNRTLDLSPEQYLLQVTD